MGPVVLLIFSLAAPASAQTAQPAPPPPAVTDLPLDPAAVDRLIETLQDDQARARLIETLQALKAAQERLEPEERLGLAGRFLEALSIQVGALGDSVTIVARGFAGLPELAQWGVAELRDPVQRRLLLERTLTVIVTLMAGALTYGLMNLALRPARQAINVGQPQPLFTRLAMLAVRLALDLVAAAALLIAGITVLSLIDPPAATRLVALALINAAALTLAIMAVANLLLAPTAPGLRLFAISDETAHYLYLWVRRLVVVGVFGTQLADAARLAGAPAAAYDLLIRLLGFLIAIMVAMLVLQNRRDVADWLDRRTGQAGRRGVIASVFYRLADIWHVLAIALIALIYVMWFVSPADGGRFVATAMALTALIVVAARLLDHAVDRAVRRGFRVPADVAARFPGLEARANRYVPLVRWSLSVVIWALAIIVALAAWGVDSIAWLATGAGREVVASAVSIAIVVGLAAMVWEFVNSAVERYLAARDAEGRIIERSARTRTLLPLIRNSFLLFLLAVVGLTVLSEVGVNIAPLLAGAGIVGLAIGFGSQSLVRDVITGLFNLVEDTVSVGDVATVGGHTGLVEAISIRTLRLRDLSGSVHTVPWGDVTSVVNLTRDFSYYVMDIGVAYREDVDAVIEAVKQLGSELQADPTFGRDLLGPLEILGLDNFADSAVVIKARLKTFPGKQWSVGREFNRRLKRRFDELGIDIPFPHRTIYFGQDKSGNAPPAHVAVAGPQPAAGGGQKARRSQRPRRKPSGAAKS